MSKNKSILYIFVTLIIAASAITLSVNASIKAEDRFIIAIPESHKSLIKDVSSLTSLLDKPVDIMIHPDESALIRSIRNGEADAFITSSFNFISDFSKLNHAKAIFGIPSDYYLVSRIGADGVQNKVAVFDPYISQILQNGASYSTMTIYGTHERLVTLEEAYVSHIIMHASYFDSEKYTIINQLSTRGYTQDLFVLTSEWIDYDQENEHALLDALEKALRLPLEKPIEDELIRAMSHLFRLETISTRYYYSDLVYSKD